MAIEQFIAIISTLVLFFANAALAMLLGRIYLKERSISSLIWSSGMRIFAIAVLLELLFAFGVYSSFLGSLYLFAIAMPLLAFSIGYMQFIKSKIAKQFYYYYCIGLAFLLLYLVFSTSIDSIFQNYAIYGSIPFSISIISLLIGLSSIIVLSAIAIVYYMMKRNLKILAIIPGALLFFLNNVIHFAALSPLLLYYYQLLGIILIWLGFVGFSSLKEYPQ